MIRFLASILSRAISLSCGDLDRALAAFREANERALRLSLRVVELEAECRELTRDHVALMQVSGALCDAGDVPVEPYGDAVRLLTRQRDDAQQRVVELEAELRATRSRRYFIASKMLARAREAEQLAATYRAQMQEASKRADILSAQLLECASAGIDNVRATLVAARDAKVAEYRKLLEDECQAHHETSRALREASKRADEAKVRNLVEWDRYVTENTSHLNQRLRGAQQLYCDTKDALEKERALRETAERERDEAQRKVDHWEAWAPKSEEVAHQTAVRMDDLRAKLDASDLALSRHKAAREMLRDALKRAHACGASAESRTAFDILDEALGDEVMGGAVEWRDRRVADLESALSRTRAVVEAARKLYADCDEHMSAAGRVAVSEGRRAVADALRVYDLHADAAQAVETKNGK